MFFSFFIQSFWNLHTICGIGIISTFCYKFHLIFFDIRIVSKKKKKHMIQLSKWSWNHKEGKLSSFFFTCVRIILHQPSNRKKQIYFFSTTIRLQVHITKKKFCEWKIQSWVYIPHLSAMFWYASHLCCVRTDCVLFFLLNLILENWKVRNTPSKFWQGEPLEIDNTCIPLILGKFSCLRLACSRTFDMWWTGPAYNFWPKNMKFLTQNCSKGPLKLAMNFFNYRIHYRLDEEPQYSEMKRK